MTRTITGLCIYLLTVLCVAAAEPSPRTIPRLAAPPTQDGALAPGEWDGAARVTGLIDHALGLAFALGQTLTVTDLKGWECKGELPLDWKPEGPAGTLTLTIPPHDYRLLLVAPADPK